MYIPGERILSKSKSEFRNSKAGMSQNVREAGKPVLLDLSAEGR